MQKELPKVFENEIEKEIRNNANVYTSNKPKQEMQQIKKEQETKKTVEQKIKEIINSKKFTYKIPVIIKLKDKEVKTNVIGKNKTNIITIDNELINIEEIMDIRIQKNE